MTYMELNFLAIKLKLKQRALALANGNSKPLRLEAPEARFLRRPAPPGWGAHEARKKGQQALPSLLRTGRVNA